MSYLEEQEKAGLKPGDKVKILRKAADHEGGWLNIWCNSMDDFIGHIGIVKDRYMGSGGIPVFCADFNNWWNFPYFVLGKLEVTDASSTASPMKDKPSASMWNCVCPKCGASAYQGIGPVECSNGCK